MKVEDTRILEVEITEYLKDVDYLRIMFNLTIFEQKLSEKSKMITEKDILEFFENQDVIEVNITYPKNYSCYIDENCNEFTVSQELLSFN